MAQLIYSQNDSERFGLNIYRSYEDGMDAFLIMKQILEHDVDTAIIRIKTKYLTEIHQLEKTAMPFRITDTLAYYHFDLTTYQKQGIANRNFEFKVAGPEDHDALNKLVRATFGTYVNHYRINPFFNNEQVTEGYQDWVRRYAENDPLKKCILVMDGDKPVGFGNFNLQKEEKIKGILYGVHPDYRGRGVFRDIMTWGKNLAKDMDRGYMRATCQIENIAVQRAWTKQGFELHHTENTIHINSLLSKSVFDNFSVPMIIHREHIDIDKITNRHILREINKQFDVMQNIVTLNHRFVNIEHLKSDVEYQLTFSFPAGNKGLLRVKDAEGITYMLVYFDLRHFIS